VVLTPDDAKGLSSTSWWWSSLTPSWTSPSTGSGPVRGADPLHEPAGPGPRPACRRCWGSVLVEDVADADEASGDGRRRRRRHHARPLPTAPMRPTVPRHPASPPRRERSSRRHHSGDTEGLDPARRLSHGHPRRPGRPRPGHRPGRRRRGGRTPADAGVAPLLVQVGEEIARPGHGGRRRAAPAGPTPSRGRAGPRRARPEPADEAVPGR
jgi:hypothetical protein